MALVSLAVSHRTLNARIRRATSDNDSQEFAQS